VIQVFRYRFIQSILLLVASFLVASTSFAKVIDESCDSAFAHLWRFSKEHFQVNEDIVNKNSFVTYRTLGEYSLYLPGFNKALAELPKDGVWMDLGAGKAVAMRTAWSQDPSLTRKYFAFGVEIPSDARTAVEDAMVAGNFRYIEGKFESVDMTQLPKANLITDVFGAVSYSPDLGRVMTNALSQLVPGGKMFTYYSMMGIKIKTGLFKSEDLLDYLRNIKGIEVVDIGDEGAGAVMIQRTEGPLEIPKLKLEKVRAGKPPQFVYRYVK
jgi:hypothetical protein